MIDDAQTEDTRRRRTARGGRPTKADAAKRDERIVDIATAMFMEHGFDGTSMDRLADVAAIGKATLYTRYVDKESLFSDVLRRRIFQVYGPMEAELRDMLEGADLETVLHRAATLILEKSISSEAIALGRILAAQGARFPNLARLAVEEGVGRQGRLVGAVLEHFAEKGLFETDIPLAADLFLALVIGRTTRLAIYGVAIDADHLDRRTEIAVAMFSKALRAGFLRASRATASDLDSESLCDP